MDRQELEQYRAQVELGYLAATAMEEVAELRNAAHEAAVALETLWVAIGTLLLEEEK